MGMPISRDDVIGQRIGNEGAQDAEDDASDEERQGVRHDLMVNAGEAQIVPGKGGKTAIPDDQRAGPKGGAENRYESPRIVNECAGKERNEIQAEGPGAKDDHGRMESIGRGEGDEDADGKRQCGSMG